MMFIRAVEWRCDNGLSVKFGAGSHMLGELTDTLGASAQVVKAPGQHGATTYRITLGQPVINLVCSIHAAYGSLDEKAAALADMEDEIKRAFMPNRFGLLIDHRVNGARQIRCHAVEKPAFGRIIQGTRTVDIELIADAPLWESAEATELNLGAEIGGFRFPLVLPTVMGYYDKQGVVNNPTPEDIFPTIDIYTASAYVAVLNQTSGKKLQIDRAIGANQKMRIETAAARAAIWQRYDTGGWEYVADVSNWLTLDSEYWPMIPGDNSIMLTNETPGESVIATVTFHEPL